MFGCVTDPVMGKLSPKTVFENQRSSVVSLTDKQKAKTEPFREFGHGLPASTKERFSVTPWDRPWPPHGRRCGRRSCIRHWMKRPDRRPSTWNRVPHRCRGAGSDRRRRRARGTWRPSSGRPGSCKPRERAAPHRRNRRMSSFHFFTVSTSFGILSFSASASIVSALMMTPFLISSELSSLHL